MAATITASSILGTAQTYPEGRLAWINFTATFAAGNTVAINVNDVLTSAYSSGVTGTLLEVWDNGGGTLVGTDVLTPYKGDVAKIEFRESDTGALAATAADVVGIQFGIAVVLA